MKRLWSADELGERWSLEDVDFALLGGIPDAGKLGLACQLAFWRSQGCFPDEETDIAPAVIAHLARQIDVPVDAIESYAFRGCSSRRHRQLNNVRRYTLMPKGGHFPGWEVPDLYADDLRAHASDCIDRHPDKRP